MIEKNFYFWPSYSPLPLINQNIFRSKFTFRAEVLNARNDDVYEVVAVDFGWSTCVPKTCVYECDDDLQAVQSFAMLCKLSDVVPKTNKLELELHTLELLHKLCQKPSLAKTMLHLQKHRISLLLSHFYKSHEYAKIEKILTIFAAISVNPELAKEIIDPFSKHVCKYIECATLMRPVMMLFSNVFEKVPNVAQMLIKGPGTDLLVNIYLRHRKDSAIKAYFIEIMKKIFHECDLKVQSSSEQQDELEYFNPPVKRTDKTYDFSREFSNGQKLPNDMCALLITSCIERVNSKEEKRALGREICSFLNSKQGGTIYVGVLPHTWIIKGLRYGKKERDNFNLLVDDILTDGKLLRYGSNVGTKIRKENVQSKFIDLNNTFKVPLKTKMGEEYQIVEIKVEPSRDDLVLFNEGELKDGITMVHDWTCYGRSAEHGRKLLDFNEVRQYIAHIDRYFYSVH